MNKIIRFIVITLLAIGFTTSSRSAAHAQGISEPISPSGTITTTTPTYTWAQVDGATQYELQLNQDATIIYTGTIAAGACLATQNCVITPLTALAAGSYTWQVRAQVADAWTDYSAAVDFTIINAFPDPNDSPETEITSANALPIPISPNGSIRDTTPTFIWSQIPDVTSYDIYLSFDSTFYVDTVAASSCDASGNCSYTPTRVLSIGNYTWGIGVTINHSWSYSPNKTFTVINSIPSLVAPSGTIDDSTPTYTWIKVLGATQYEYQLYKNTVLVYTQSVAANTCGSIQNCASTPDTGLPDGDYAWKVRAMVDGSWWDYSPETAFTLINKIPTPISPGDISENTTPAYTWTKISGATAYILSSYSTIGYGSYRLLANVDASACGPAENCSYIPTDVLSPGYYTWNVRAVINGSPTDYSFSKNFSVFSPISVAITPSGAIHTTAPIFIWKQIIGATQYEYQVTQGASIVFTHSVDANSACSQFSTGTICNNNPAAVLPYGSYEWQVRAMVNGIWLDYSAKTTFIVVNPYPILISPVGTIKTSSPTFSWKKVTDATSYYVAVHDHFGLNLYQVFVYQNQCGTTENCVITPALALPNGNYSWSVNAYGENYGETKGIFTILDYSPTPIKPVDTIYVATPTYVWTRILTSNQEASKYELLLFKDGVRVYSKIFSNSNCRTQEYCSSTPSIALLRGNYSWKVHAMIQNIWQDFSPVKTFTIILPTVPRPLTPSGTIKNTTPTFSWTKISGAAQYQYQLYKGTTLVYTQTVLASTCGSKPNCLNTPKTVLAHADYTWKVRALLDGVWQDYSVTKAFKLP